VDGVYWTRWAELRFYVLIVLLVAVGITRRRVLAFCALWPLAAVAAEALRLEHLSMLLISGYAPLFAGGMLLYVLHRDGHAWAPWLLLAGNAALALAEVVPAQVRSISEQTVFAPSPVVLAVVLLACFGAVAACALTPLRSLGWSWLAS